MNPLRFIHTADWQIGKPFAGVTDPENRAKLRDERVEAVKRIGELARTHQARFVLVAGDLFDTPTPDNKTVAAACSAIGSIGIPVIAIPGNHDHAGPGSIWTQAFFRREQVRLAPNFILLDQPKPYSTHSAIILPCPLLRRQESTDVTAWLHDDAWQTGIDPALPRIVLAHGSTQGFSSVADGEESPGQPNLIHLDRLPAPDLDYIALGDWHGTKHIANAAAGKAWYAGTPEPDRFPKGDDHHPGHILLVELPVRGHPPAVTPLPTAHLGWHEVNEHLTGDADLPRLEAALKARLGSRAREDLLKLHLTGTVGLNGEQTLLHLLDSMQARLLRLKLDNEVVILPSDEEIQLLAGRTADPLIATLASRLLAQTSPDHENHTTATLALRALYALVGGNP